MIRVENVSKTFVLHQQNGVRLPVLQNATLEVKNGECVVLHGHSGSGKSTLLRSLYANYLPDEGHIHIRHSGEWVDLVQAPARKVLEVRRSTIGWVSQFLRVIPRISALDVVMQPLLDLGVSREECAAKAANLLTRLNVPERLWHLAPSTFSGGEQQRVNIARGFIVDYPILLLDEPTASLDAKNSAAVVALIEEAKARVQAQREAQQAKKREAAAAAGQPEEGARRERKPRPQPQARRKEGAEQRKPRPAAAAKAPREERHTPVSDVSVLTVGQALKVKAGNNAMDATVLEITKDGVRVQLTSGMSMIVRAEHLVF